MPEWCHVGPEPSQAPRTQDSRCTPISYTSWGTLRFWGTGPGVPCSPIPAWLDPFLHYPCPYL